MKLLFFILITTISVFASIGKITAIKGEVYIYRDSKELLARIGSILELKDTIKTQAKSKAIVLFNDKTSITVGKKSTMSIEKYVFNLSKPKKSKATFRFGQGVFRTISGKIGKLNRKKFKVKTQTASIGIRGTNFIVKVSPAGDMQIGVQEGGVYFVPTGSTTAVNVDKGFKVSIAKGAKSFKTEPMKADDELQSDVDEKDMKKEKKAKVETKKETKKKQKAVTKKENKSSKEESKKSDTKQQSKQNNTKKQSAQKTNNTQNNDSATTDKKSVKQEEQATKEQTQTNANNTEQKDNIVQQELQDNKTVQEDIIQEDIIQEDMIENQKENIQPQEKPLLELKTNSLPKGQSITQLPLTMPETTIE